MRMRDYSRYPFEYKHFPQWHKWAMYIMMLAFAIGIPFIL